MTRQIEMLGVPPPDPDSFADSANAADREGKQLEDLPGVFQDIHRDGHSHYVIDLRCQRTKPPFFGVCRIGIPFGPACVVQYFDTEEEAVEHASSLMEGKPPHLIRGI